MVPALETAIICAQQPEGVEDNSGRSSHAGDCDLPSVSCLTAHRLAYYTHPAGSVRRRQLLHDVTAAFVPGVCAIMGPSGAGKSVLLGCLALRRRGGVVAGSVAIKGQVIVPGTPDHHHYLQRWVGGRQRQPGACT